jgi:LmbE family N-acetylglucosaminyl deacetylase
MMDLDKEGCMMNARRVLILCPHTDDGDLGAGGTIARFVEEGKEVYYAAFSACELSLPSGLSKDAIMREFWEAVKILGIAVERTTTFDYEVRTFPLHRQEILEHMVRLNDRIKPDLVIIPSSNDLHQDHHVIYSESLRAFKGTSSIWGYEHPWNNVTFTTDIFVRLEPKHLRIKLNALKQYKSQSYRSYMDSTFIKSLAYTRGVQSGFKYAEAFEIVRLLI